MSRKPQLSLLKSEPKAYGGSLFQTRKGRARGRPLDTKNTLHLVLKSSQATGEWSFRRPDNSVKIRSIVSRFAQKFGVRVLSIAVVGNHIHMQIKLGNRFTYFPFIRATTAAIAMAISGISRWSKPTEKTAHKFWDYRPFTRVIIGFRAYLGIKDYIGLNQIEGYGYSRRDARMIQAYEYDRRHRDTG